MSNGEGRPASGDAVEVEVHDARSRDDGDAARRMPTT